MHLTMDRLHGLYYHAGRHYFPRGFVRPLAIVGGLYLAKQLFDLTTWTWTHVLRSGDVKEYLDKDQATWALVTGASAGIGKGFVQELASQGFNVILHGRNEAKLGKFKAELQRQYPKLEFELLVLDADDFTIADLQAGIERIQHLNIRILINNVAGGGKNEKPVIETFHHRTAESIDSWINVTARFPTHITRQLLPLLIEKKSALVVNIGSGNSEMTIPYLTMYSGLKAYNKVWSRALTLELQADGNEHVEVIAIIVGRTVTERQDEKPSLSMPTSRQMARSSLAATGCGRSVIAAYWPHAVQAQILELIPARLLRGTIFAMVKQMKQDEKNGKIFHQTNPTTLLTLGDISQMGLRMDDLHSATVPSGPTTHPTANGGPAKRTLNELMAAKEALETQLSALGAVLDSHGANMNTSLTTFDGYPRADLDVAQIRTTRAQIIRLKNDHKALMKELEIAVEEQFAARKAGTAIETIGASDTARPQVAAPAPVVEPPFAKVNTVVSGSPADDAGLKPEDRICKFAFIDWTNHERLTRVAQVVQVNEGRQILVRVIRESTTLDLQLTPRSNWGGRGMLGCHLLPL